MIKVDRIKALLVPVLLLNLAVTGTAGNWPMFRHDAAHSGAADEAVMPPLELLWKYPIGFSYYPPSVLDGTVYADGDDKIYALDAMTGALKWKYQAEGQVTSPAIYNGKLYFGSIDFNVYALDAATGALKWKYKTGGQISFPPVALGGSVYVSSYDSNVYALDAETGTLKWKYFTGGMEVKSPAVFSGVVYVSEVGHVSALSAASGTLRWKFTPEGTVSYSMTTPVVSGDTVYVGSADSVMYALDATTGIPRWTYRTGADIVSSPAVSDDMVYTGSWDYNVYGIYAANGNLKWRFATGNFVSFSPLISGDIIYISSKDMGFLALDAQTGELRWRYIINGFIREPVVSGGAVYVVIGDYLYAFAPVGTQAQLISKSGILLSAAGFIAVLYGAYQLRRKRIKTKN